jgi:hypothetical protein
VKVWAYPILVVALVGIGYYIWEYPKSLYIISAITVLIWAETLWERRRRRRLAMSRSGESICSFVDSFDCRHTDTWILRAVYEELSRYLAVEGHPMPIRADDQCFEGDLRIDREDLDDLAVDVAARSRRSMDEADRNPYYGKVRTVRDLVGFFEHQPRLETSNKALQATATAPSS